MNNPSDDDSKLPLNLVGKTSYLDILEKDRAPAYSADGPFVLTGYRPQMSLSECLCTMFTWHNQTINIWTSVALVVFNLWLVVFFTAQYPDMSSTFVFFFWVQGVLRSYCWFNSWAYHTFVCHSAYAANALCTMDYIGCYLTPLGMGTNMVFIELYCNRPAQILFLIIGFIGIVAAIILSTLPVYQTETYRTVRLFVSIFSTMPYLAGLIAAVFLVHQEKVPGYYLYFLYALVFELSGAFFYVTMIPEKFIPRILDNWLASHTLWHWLNFGFDSFMMALAFAAFQDLMAHGRCI